MTAMKGNQMTEKDLYILCTARYNYSWGGLGGGRGSGWVGGRVRGARSRRLRG